MFSDWLSIISRMRYIFEGGSLGAILQGLTLGDTQTWMPLVGVSRGEEGHSGNMCVAVSCKIHQARSHPYHVKYKVYSGNTGVDRHTVSRLGFWN